jgi:hypothetical protein
MILGNEEISVILTKVTYKDDLELNSQLHPPSINST